MISVAVIGANGFVGSALVEALRRCGRYAVEPITRQTFDDGRKREYDMVVNSAMPAARFWAKQHPEKDFVETVEKTARIAYGYRYRKLVQISSVSARCQLDTVYGRHKAAAEALVSGGENAIFRLSSMYSTSLTKGVLVDMLNNRKVFVSAQSAYSFAPLEFVAGYLAKNLDRSGIVEVGARDVMLLRSIADHLHSTSEFEGDVDIQSIENPEPTFPRSADVLPFLTAWRRSGSLEEMT